MTSCISVKPNLIFSPFTGTINPRFRRSHFGSFPNHLTSCSFRRPVLVAQLGFKPGSVEAIKELFARAESVVYTIADAAVSSSDTVTDTTTMKQNSDWFSGITSYMETVLKVLQDGLSTLHVPYAYGFAIILLTVLVKAATFPLTKKQVESAMAMKSLQPQIKAIQERYAGDQERIQLETARVYKLAGINPFAGCLPTLATIPVWIGLYRALSNVADEGLLTEGFFWIPSLAGPTTIAARQNGSGISWLFPFVDGHPPLGWSDTLAYLVLPLLLVLSQYISVQIMQSSQNNDPTVKNSQAVTKFLPLMIGYFALSVPSGLSLYWLTNNILSTAQQVWLQKFGGAKNPVRQFTDEIIKEEKPQVRESVSELKTLKETRVPEKSTPEGPQPGERFKQLKEQEARRKQRREEERTKAEEAAATKANQAENGALGESDVLDTENGSGIDVAEGSYKRRSSVTGQDFSKDGAIVNGNLSNQGSMEKDEVSAANEVERKDEKQSNENVEKEYTTVSTTDRISEDGAQPANRE